MGVLDGFFSTWSKARNTFGAGTPQTGDQYDKSGALTTMQATVQSAAPGSKWTGTAAAAYNAANTDHSEVFGKLAGLDQRLSAQITQSSQVVDAGRRNLDSVRDWVVSAAGSVPKGKNCEQMLMPIVSKGLGQVTDIVTKANGELSTIGGAIRGIGADYDTLKDQKFGAKGDDAVGVKGDDGKKPADQAADDFKAVKDGTATPEQVARVRAAATLSAPQLDSLKQGKPATMDQGQYDYLKGLMTAQDGMSATQIDQSFEKYPELKGAMGDAYRVMGNPNIQTAAGDHGGITNVPKNIQALLNDDLLYKTPGGAQVPQIPIHQFDALNEMLGHGNQDLRVGSDVDRALLNESSKIADLVDRGHAVYSDSPDSHGGRGGIPFGIANTDDINKTLNSMADNASGDHQAVTDFLSGANDSNSAGAHRMGDATFGHFTGNEGFRDLATHHFGDGQDGVKHMFDWMGPNAYTQGLEGFDAAASANASAHLLANNSDYFNKLSDGHGGYTTLGHVNAGLTQTLTANLSPYIGNLDGVQTPGISTAAIPGCTDTKDLTNMFKVLDTDPASAQALNNVVAQWEQHFAYDYGLTGDSELGRHAGQLTQSMQNANQSTLETLKSYQDWDGIRAYQDRSAHWDTTTSILKDVAGFAPGGSWAVQLGDLASPYAKDDVLGVPGDPGKMTDSEWEKALTKTNENFNHLVDGRVREFNIAQGYLDSHPDSRSQFSDARGDSGQPVNFLDQNGRLDWKAIEANSSTFARLMDNESLASLHNWGDSNHGYESGLNDTNIDPRTLPDPTIPPQDAPRGPGR